MSALIQDAASFQRLYDLLPSVIPIEFRVYKYYRIILWRLNNDLWVIDIDKITSCWWLIKMLSRGVDLGVPVLGVGLGLHFTMSLLIRMQIHGGLGEHIWHSNTVFIIVFESRFSMLRFNSMNPKDIFWRLMT